MRISKRIKSLVVGILTGVFVLLMLNNSFNRHNHLVSGYLYTHAHPFRSGGSEIPAQAHSHSALEFVILDLLSNFSFVQIALPGVIAILSGFIILQLITKSFHPAERPEHKLIPRAPPVLTFQLS